jgi:hypothetical protein
METTKLILLTFLFITLASCVPDSLTKFEEPEVAKDISGGSSEVVDVDTSEGTLTGVSITQTQGDILILKVDNVDNFNVGDNINVSSLAVSSSGTNSFASIIAITQQDDGDFFLTVTLSVATAIPATYVSVDNFLDNCSTGFSSCGATSVGASQVTFVGFYISPTSSFSKTFNSIVSSTAMDLTYAVSPSFPNSIQIDENTVGDNSDDAIESPVGPFRIDSSNVNSETYAITVSVTNFGDELDEDTEQQELNFFITGKIPGNNIDEDSATNLNGTMIPTGASVGRYQYLKLEGNASRFYRGSRIAINTTDNINNIVGKVLLTDDSSGVLVEATGDIKPGDGIDNTSKFYSNETTIKQYEYWYVASVTNFDIGDTVTTSSGDTALIEDVTVDTNRLYVLIQNGAFEIDELLTEDDVASTTTLLSSEKRSFVNGVIEVANTTNFTIGGSITTAAGDKALVVAKDDTDDLLYILHLSGTFSENEGIDNADTYVGDETTITAIVGPIVSLSTVGGSSTSSGVDFREGSLVSSSNGATQRAAGYAVAGTNISANTLVVQLEHYDNNKWFDITNNLDDYTVTNIGLGSPYTIAGSDLSQLMIGYVDESIHVEPFVLGSFSNASIAPDILPAGLTFDNLTGTISGTPTEATSKLDYVISFSYPGETSVTYSFSMIVYNQFEITQVTDDGSSFLLHKEGRGLAGAKCKVFGAQVIDDPTDALYGDSLYGFNDVVCRLEAGEQDLYTEGVKLNIKAGGGMCEFVRYKPFSYQGISAGATSATYVKYAEFDGSACLSTVTNGIDPSILTAAAPQARPVGVRDFDQTYCHSGSSCISNDANPAIKDSEDGFCSYDHSLLQTGGGAVYPNTDTGSYNLVTVACELTDEAAGVCTCASTVTKVECGGDQSKRIAGPIHDTAINVAIENSVIYSSFDSLSESLELKAPITSGADGNYRLANYTAKNSCYSAAPGNSYHIEDSVAVGLTTFNDTWESFNNSNDAFGGTNLNQFYGFECLNAAGDVKARIRLQVRDWDRTFVPENTEVEELIPASPMDDSTASCFGSNCNNRADFDDNIGTNLATCSSTDALSAGLTVDIVAGSHFITANTGTFNASQFRKGTIFYVGPAGELPFIVEEHISTGQVKVTRPSPQDGTNLQADFYDGFRFPLQGLIN